jgi:hypothetical protein
VSGVPSSSSRHTGRSMNDITHGTGVRDVRAPEHSSLFGESPYALTSGVGIREDTAQFRRRWLVWDTMGLFHLIMWVLVQIATSREGAKSAKRSGWEGLHGHQDFV